VPFVGSQADPEVEQERPIPGHRIGFLVFLHGDRRANPLDPEHAAGRAAWPGAESSRGWALGSGFHARIARGRPQSPVVRATGPPRNSIRIQYRRAPGRAYWRLPGRPLGPMPMPLEAVDCLPDHHGRGGPAASMSWPGSPNEAVTRLLLGLRLVQPDGPIPARRAGRPGVATEPGGPGRSDRSEDQNKPPSMSA
jgi:hypothetical protein